MDRSNFFKALPVELLTRKAHGKEIDFVGGDRFSSFWRENKDILIYDAVIDSEQGVPIFKVKGTQKVVGSIVQTNSRGPSCSYPHLQCRS